MGLDLRIREISCQAGYGINPLSDSILPGEYMPAASCGNCSQCGGGSCTSCRAEFLKRYKS